MECLKDKLQCCFWRSSYDHLDDRHDENTSTNDEKGRKTRRTKRLHQGKKSRKHGLKTIAYRLITLVKFRKCFTKVKVCWYKLNISHTDKKNCIWGHEYTDESQLCPIVLQTGELKVELHTECTSVGNGRINTVCTQSTTWHLERYLDGNSEQANAQTATYAEENENTTTTPVKYETHKKYQSLAEEKSGKDEEVAEASYISYSEEPENTASAFLSAISGDFNSDAANGLVSNQLWHGLLKLMGIPDSCIQELITLLKSEKYSIQSLVLCWWVVTNHGEELSIRLRNRLSKQMEIPDSYIQIGDNDHSRNSSLQTNTTSDQDSLNSFDTVLENLLRIGYNHLEGISLHTSSTSNQDSLNTFTSVAGEHDTQSIICQKSENYSKFTNLVHDPLMITHNVRELSIIEEKYSYTIRDMNLDLNLAKRVFTDLQSQIRRDDHVLTKSVESMAVLQEGNKGGTSQYVTVTNEEVFASLHSHISLFTQESFVINTPRSNRYMIHSEELLYKKLQVVKRPAYTVFYIDRESLAYALRSAGMNPDNDTSGEEFNDASISDTDNHTLTYLVEFADDCRLYFYIPVLRGFYLQEKDRNSRTMPRSPYCTIVQVNRRRGSLSNHEMGTILARAFESSDFVSKSAAHDGVRN